MPRPTRPIDDAGPLNGNTPPILISVAVTPGVSAANAGADSASTRANASFDFPNITFSHHRRKQGLPPQCVPVGTPRPLRPAVLPRKLQFFFRTSQAILKIIQYAAVDRSGFRIGKRVTIADDLGRQGEAIVQYL